MTLKIKAHFNLLFFRYLAVQKSGSNETEQMVIFQWPWDDFETAFYNRYRFHFA